MDQLVCVKQHKFQFFSTFPLWIVQVWDNLLIFRTTQIHSESGIQAKSESSGDPSQNSQKACQKQCVLLRVFWWGTHSTGREELQWEQRDPVLRGQHSQGTTNQARAAGWDPEGHSVPPRGESPTLHTRCQERTTSPSHPQNTHTQVRQVWGLQQKKPGAPVRDFPTKGPRGDPSASCGGPGSGVRQWWYSEGVSRHSSH